MAEPIRFTADTNIEEALLLDDRVVKALQQLGLKCVDKKRDEMCVAATVETLREAALYHEIPLEKILEPLNAPQLAPKPQVPPTPDSAPLPSEAPAGPEAGRAKEGPPTA